MGHVLSPTTGKPTFNNTPSTVSDLQAAADYTDQIGAASVPTVADLELITYPRKGEQRMVEADGSVWLYNGTGWVQTGGAVYNARALRSSGALAFGVAYTDLSANANWDTTAPGGQVEGFAAYSNGWTIPATGVYEVSHGISATQAFMAGITVNKSASVALADLKIAATAALAQGRAACSAAGQIYLVAGDVIRLFAISASGTATTDVSMGQFSIAWLRSA